MRRGVSIEDDPSSPENASGAPPPRTGHDVFISHSSKDKAAADAVCAILEQRKIRCWIAPRDITPGKEWGEAIIDAIAGSRMMILIFSANANDSPQISREVERAVNKQVVIVPLRIEDVAPTKSLEYFIGSVHWLDALHQPLESHLERIAGVVEGALEGDASAAAKQASESPQRPAPIVGWPIRSVLSRGGTAAHGEPRLGRTQKSRRVLALGLAGALGTVALLAAGGLYFRSHQQSNRLTEKDTIVVSDFTNTTGDAVFDDTLKTALNVSLQQSPFLNVLSDSQVAKTLQQMTRPTGTKLTPELVRELCLRAHSKAYLAGSIGSLGSEYVLGLKAVNCQNGDTLAQEQVTASSKEKVLDALGKTASRLRSELGESLATVQKFDVPLAEATTSSLEALKAFSLGRKTFNEKGSASALPFDHHAIELDPNFAVGYDALGVDYSSLGELERSSEYHTKAFQLREHASEREKLAITAYYYDNVTGELNRAVQTYQEQIESYPRAPAAYVNLGVIFAAQGQYDKAADVTRKAVQLSPETLAWDPNLANYALALQRIDEARQIVRDALAHKKGDDFILHDALYALAFLGADSAAMAEQQKWFADKPDYENAGLALASDTEAYAGHLRNARDLTKRAVDSAIRADSKESAAVWQANSALQEAAFGNPTEARQLAAEALKLAPTSQGAESEAALAFAMAGDTARAESLAKELGKRSPLATQMQSLWLPTIQAQLALDRKNPAPALNALQAAEHIELGQIDFVANLSCLYPVYVRGQAYLAAGQGAAASVEFHKILDHSGIVWNCWTGALAHLGVARANALQSRSSQGADSDAARVRALTAYKDFLTLWKDADPGIPILQQAKAEYAKLQ